MTMSPARRLSSALQGGFLLRILQSRSWTQESCPALQNKIPHTTAESIIFHESNLLTTFCSVTSRHHQVIISNHFLAHILLRSYQFPLPRQKWFLSRPLVNTTSDYVQSSFLNQRLQSSFSTSKTMRHCNVIIPPFLLWRNYNTIIKSVVSVLVKKRCVYAR